MHSNASSPVSQMGKKRPERKQSASKRELYVLGSGMFSYNQMTIETIEILKRCSVVYHFSIPEVDKYLRDICPKVVSLASMYEKGRHRNDVYEDMVRRVIAGARRSPRSAYLVLGHPALYDNSVHALRARASEAGLDVEVKAAVSAFDSILLELLELGVDIGETGLQIFEANRLKVFEYSLDVSVPVLLFQLGGFGSALNTVGLKSKPIRFVPLQKYLTRFYAPTHEVYVVECQVAAGHRVVRGRVQLKDLHKAGPHLNYNTSLYIPAAKCAKVKDRRFLRLAKSVKHMKSLVEEPRG